MPTAALPLFLLSLLLASCVFAEETGGSGVVYDLPDASGEGSSGAASAPGAAQPSSSGTPEGGSQETGGSGVVYDLPDAPADSSGTTQPSSTQPSTQQTTPDFSPVSAAEDKVSDAIDKQLDDSLGVYSGMCAADPSENFSFIVPTMIALLAIGSGIAILYGAGNFLGSPQLIAISRQELFELIHTLLIVAFFSSFLVFSNQFIFGAGTGGGIYDVAMDYSIKMVHKITKDTMWLSLINTLIYMLYSAPLRLGGSLHHAVHFNLGGVLKPFVDGVGTMASLLSFAIGEWIANITILCFIKRFVPNIFLPVGVLLRAFPQTRGGGNAIIAICIAFLLIYPTMLYMNNEAYKYKYGAITGRSSMEDIVSGFMSGAGWAQLSFYAFFLWLFTGQLVGIAFLTQWLVFFLDMFADVIYTVFVLSIILPLLNVFITLTFAREIAKYLGTEINIAPFVRLI